MYTSLSPEEVFAQNPTLWPRLERLRQLFLDRDESKQALGPYWRDEDDLLAYDLSFARRIANKWTQTLSKLPEDLTQNISSYEWVDWGCGSGVASESLLSYFAPPKAVHLWDHSPTARAFTRKKLESMGIQHVHDMVDPLSDLEGKVVLISHVLNELKEGVRTALLEALQKARMVIWVEAGSKLTSQNLSRCRNTLLKKNENFRVALPCPDSKSICPLGRENSQDWCHFFAHVDAEFHQSAFWREFSDRMGVDIRSLPLSSLVLYRPDEPSSLSQEGHRVLGSPRVYKGFLKVQSCHGREGVKEYILDKRSDKKLFKALKDPDFMTLCHWELNADKTKIETGNEIGEDSDDSE